MRTLQANLIPAHRLLATRRRVRLRRWIGTCAAYAAVLLAVSGLCYAAWAGESQDPAVALPATLRKISQTKQKIGTLRQGVAAAQVELAANRSVGNPPDWSVLLAAIVADMGEKIVLRRCQLGPQSVVPAPGPTPPRTATELTGAGQREYLLTVIGYGRSQPAVTQFVLRLEENGLFNDVRLIQTAREPLLAGNAVAFRLECLLGSKPTETK